MAEMDFRASKGREGRFCNNFGSRSACCCCCCSSFELLLLLLLLPVKHLNTSVATPGVQFKLILPLLFVTAAEEAERSSYNRVLIRSRRAVRLSFVLLVLLLVSVDPDPLLVGTSEEEDDDALLLSSVVDTTTAAEEEDTSTTAADAEDNNVSKSRATPSTKTETSLHPSIALLLPAVGRRADTADFISHPKA